MLLVEAIDLACSACSGVSPNLGGSFAGGVGASAASQDAPGKEPGTEPCSASSEPAAPGSSDIASDVATGLAADSALSAAAGDSAKNATRYGAGTGIRSGGAAGVLSVLFTVVSGSQTLAEGITTILRNDGRGLGGSSCGGQSGMQEAMDHIKGQRSDGTRLK